VYIESDAKTHRTPKHFVAKSNENGLPFRPAVAGLWERAQPARLCAGILASLSHRHHASVAISQRE
jgi:hypothetical protein